MVIIACLAGLIVLILLFQKTKIIKSDKLKSVYERALEGTDARRAMKTGREYYQKLRGKDKRISVMDEQTVLNDVSKMQTPP